MKLFAFLLALPLATLAQSVGDTLQQVEHALGKPQLQRDTGECLIWSYSNGTKVKFRNGVVSEIAGRDTSRVTETPAHAPVASAATAQPAKGAGEMHGSILDGCQGALMRAGGAPVDPRILTKKRFLFIYFSAHWCGPCRAFTPKLVEFYKKNIGMTDFELLFVSSDKDQGAMDGYMNETGMPWVGLKLQHPRTTQLKQKFGVRGIPCLVLLDEKDNLVASSFEGEAYRGPDVALRKYLEMHGL